MFSTLQRLIIHGGLSSCHHYSHPDNPSIRLQYYLAFSANRHCAAIFQAQKITLYDIPTEIQQIDVLCVQTHDGPKSNRGFIKRKNHQLMYVTLILIKTNSNLLMRFIMQPLPHIEAMTLSSFQHSSKPGNS